MLDKAYSFATTLAVPLVAIGLLASKRGRARYAERFGSWGEISGSPWWFHGASVGEVQGLSPVLRLLRERLPSEQILLSGTSPTGLERGSPLVDWTRLAPLDSPLLVRRAFRAFHPAQLVIAETELWPELMRQALARRVPVSIVNARISEYTKAWYSRLGSLFRPILSECRLVCVPDEQQRERFIALGVRPERVHVTGHSKYDVEPRFAGAAERSRQRASLFGDLTEASRILVLGSARPGEEHGWIAASQEAWKNGSDLRLVIVPRHQERFDYFASVLSQAAVQFSRTSQLPSGMPALGKVLMVDQMGALESCYAAADLAFVGATLVDVGGHNPFEPAMYAVPVVVGPHVAVIRHLVDELRQADAICEVTGAADMVKLVQRLFLDPGELRQAGERGQQVWMRHRGAAGRVLEHLLEAPRA